LETFRPHHFLIIQAFYRFVFTYVSKQMGQFRKFNSPDGRMFRADSTSGEGVVLLAILLVVACTPDEGG
jgi:hypothetical protein